MYDMSTMPIVTVPSGREIKFTEPKIIYRGDLVEKSLIKRKSDIFILDFTHIYIRRAKYYS